MRGDVPAGRLQPVQAQPLVDRGQPTADVQGRRRHHRRPVDHGELGGPAADVDVQHPAAVAPGPVHRTRPVRRQGRLHPVPGGGADEGAAVGGEQLGQGPRVAPPGRLAGQDDRAGVDVVAGQTRLRQPGPEQAAHGPLIDEQTLGVRGERHRGPVADLPVDHLVPAGQVAGPASEQQPGEEHLAGRRPDVDADGGQLDPVQLVQRMLGVVDRHLVVLVVLMIVVMVVVAGHRGAAGPTGVSPTRRQ